MMITKKQKQDIIKRYQLDRRIYKLESVPIKTNAESFIQKIKIFARNNDVPLKEVAILFDNDDYCLSIECSRYRTNKELNEEIDRLFKIEQDKIKMAVMQKENFQRDRRALYLKLKKEFEK